MNKNVLVDVDIEVEFEDVLEYIEKANTREKKELSNYLYNKSDDNDDDDLLSYNNLYDREKFLILKKAMEKYDLEELIKRLDIKQNET